MNCGSGSAKYGFGSLLLFLIMRLKVLTFFFQNEILILSLSLLSILSLPCLHVRGCVRACTVACARARLRARVHGCGHAWRWRACVRARLPACVPAYVLPACVRPPRFTILFVPHALYLHPDKILDYTFLLCATFLFRTGFRMCATFLFRTGFRRKPVPFCVNVRACVRTSI
jgi:hypothetical protein